MDFGIAKLDVRSLNLDDPQTRAGTLMGTPFYMSPEQCRGAGKVDDRSDVYSLGVMFYQMLTGRLPFMPSDDAGGESSVLFKHVFEQPPRPRDLVPTISEEMQTLVLDMLKKDRADRPSMSDVCARIEEMSGSQSLASDLSITFEEAPPTTRHLEPATVVSGPALSAVPSMPSTLGGGTGQMVKLGPLQLPSIRSLTQQQTILAAAGGVAVFSVILMVVLWTARSRTSATDSGGLKGARQCELVSEPLGATVFREADGVALGKTPWQYTQPRGEGPIVLVLRHPGHTDRALALDCSTGSRRSERLEQLPATPPVVKAPPTSPRVEDPSGDDDADDRQAAAPTTKTQNKSQSKGKGSKPKASLKKGKAGKKASKKPAKKSVKGKIKGVTVLE